MRSAALSRPKHAIRMFAGVGILALALSLVACGGQAGADAPTTATHALTAAEAAAPTSGAIKITGIQVPATGGNAQDQAVTLQNVDSQPINMTGWMLMAGDGAYYTLPVFILSAGADVTIHVCKGANDAANLYWGRCQPTWPTTGGTAM